MDTDELSRGTMDEYDEDLPHMWDLPCSDNNSVSTSAHSVTKNNKFVDTKTTDKGYFCVKQREHGRKFRVEGYSSCGIPGEPIRNAVTGYYEIDYMGKATSRIGSPDEDKFFKVVLAINGIGADTRTLFYDSVGQYERHYRTRASQSTLDIWNKKSAMVYAREPSQPQIFA